MQRLYWGFSLFQITIGLSPVSGRFLSRFYLMIKERCVVAVTIEFFKLSFFLWKVAFLVDFSLSLLSESVKDRSRRNQAISGISNLDFSDNHFYSSFIEYHIFYHLKIELTDKSREKVITRESLLNSINIS